MDKGQEFQTDSEDLQWSAHNPTCLGTFHFSRTLHITINMLNKYMYMLSVGGTCITWVPLPIFLQYYRLSMKCDLYHLWIIIYIGVYQFRLLLKYIPLIIITLQFFIIIIYYILSKDNRVTLSFSLEGSEDNVLKLHGQNYWSVWRPKHSGYYFIFTGAADSRTNFLVWTTEVPLSTTKLSGQWTDNYWYNIKKLLVSHCPEL